MIAWDGQLGSWTRGCHCYGAAYLGIRPSCRSVLRGMAFRSGVAKGALRCTCSSMRLRSKGVRPEVTCVRTWMGAWVHVQWVRGQWVHGQWVHGQWVRGGQWVRRGQLVHGHERWLCG